jgi:hypothetical protein
MASNGWREIGQSVQGLTQVSLTVSQRAVARSPWALRLPKQILRHGTTGAQGALDAVVHLSPKLHPPCSLVKRLW